MNQKLIIRLAQNRVPLPVDRLDSSPSEGGIVLNGETSAWPRGVRFSFEGVGGTKNVLEALRRQSGLGSKQHSFTLTVADGALVFTTLKPNALPMGTYEFGLRVAGLDFMQSSTRFTLQNGELEKEFTLAAKPESRRLLVQSSLNADERLVALLAQRTRLDEFAGHDWLQQSTPRVHRQACLLNLLAALRSTQSEGLPWLEAIEQIFFADVDRLYARVGAGFFNTLNAMADDPRQTFTRDRGPLAATHLKLKRRFSSEDQAAADRYTFKSYRQNAQPSLQIVIAIPPDDRPRSFYADVDLDLGNPQRDLAGAVIHLGEVLNPGQTDHLKLRQTLARNPQISRHLHYLIT